MVFVAAHVEGIEREGPMKLDAEPDQVMKNAYNYVKTVKMCEFQALSREDDVQLQ